MGSNKAYALQPYNVMQAHCESVLIQYECLATLMTDWVCAVQLITVL